VGLFEALKAINRAVLIYVSITGMDRRGPYRDLLPGNDMARVGMLAELAVARVTSYTAGQARPALYRWAIRKVADSRADRCMRWLGPAAAVDSSWTALVKGHRSDISMTDLRVQPECMAGAACLAAGEAAGAGKVTLLNGAAFL